MFVIDYIICTILVLSFLLFVCFFFSPYFNSNSIKGATHFVFTWFAADIIGGRRSQGY